MKYPSFYTLLPGFEKFAINLLIMIIFLVIIIGSMKITNIQEAEKLSRLEAVITFCENVLEYGRDRYGDVHSPLFIDGINIYTLQPPPTLYGEHSDEVTDYIGSNFADQQILLRTLAGLSHLTGDPKYTKAARDAINWHFERQHPSGLLDWGHHRYIDLRTLEVVGDKDKVHELKENFPYFELMYETNPQATEKLIEGIWNSHVNDWGKLSFNRHAAISGVIHQSAWDHTFHDPDPYYEYSGHTLLSGGGDMIDAAARLYGLTENEKALEWAKNLKKMYVKARYPDTNLGAYVFTVNPGYHMDEFTDEFGELALMGNVLFRFTFLERGYPEQIYGDSALNLLRLAQELGDSGRKFLEWTHIGMKSYAEIAYNPETNMLIPMWTDGTDMTGYEFKSDGYFGREGDVMEKFAASDIFLLSYATLFRLTEDEMIWDTVRGMANGNGLGDIGDADGNQISINFDTKNDSPKTLLSVLEIFKATQNQDYLELAIKIGDNILQHKFHNGFFVHSENHYVANFNALEPLALLTLEAAVQNKPEIIPNYNAGGEFHWSRIVRAATWQMK